MKLTKWIMGILIWSIFITDAKAQSNLTEFQGEIQLAQIGESSDLTQTSQTITHHVVYRLIYDLGAAVNPPRIWVMKMSADGSRLVFATPPTGDFLHPKIYTIKTDGTELTQLFDYASLAARGHNRMYLDISGDGSRVIWTDGVGEIYIANSTGGGLIRLATAMMKKDGKTEGPTFTVWPRITADGQKVYWIHTGSNPDVAGGYSVNADGSGQEQLFSYRRISADIFGKDGNEYNSNIAFDRGMAISDDGGRMVFFSHYYGGDGALISFDGSLKKIYSWVPISEAPFSLSRDGSRVMIVTNGGAPDSLVLVRTSGGIDRVSHIFKNTDYSPIFSEMSADGFYVIFHSASRGLSLVSAPGYGRTDLLRTGRWLSGDDNVFYRAGLGYTVSLSSDGKRFSFKTELNAQSQKIWIADIDGPLQNDVPSVSQAEFIPNWLLKNGSTRSAFKVYTNKSQVAISTVHVSSYWNGEFVQIVEDVLRDDGSSKGDAVADDGIYTHGWISCYDPNPDPVIPLTITACLVAGSRTVVSTFDIETLFILKDQPAGSGPYISSIEPDIACVDSLVTIHGENFALESYNNIVMFDDRAAWVVESNIERNRLKVIVPHGLLEGTVSVTVTAGALTSNTYELSIKTDVEKIDSVPVQSWLAQNYPNPFNSATTLFFSLNKKDHVCIKVYDILGQEVEMLVHSEFDAGLHQIVFDGRELPSGVYFYTFQTSERYEFKKMVLMR